MKTKIYQISNRIHFQPHGFFYATSVDVANRHFTVDTLPAVIVYKEHSHYYFPRKYFNVLVREEMEGVRTW